MNNAGRFQPEPPAQDAPTVQRVAKPEPLDLEVAKLTDVGRVRSHNEDYVDYFIPSDPEQLARKGSLYVVADGMGGHQAGEVASRRAVEAVIAYYYGDAEHDVGTSLVRAVQAANHQVYTMAQSDPTKAGMGTTLVAVVILGRKVYVANVGDSRAYLINSQGIRQITEDHSWVEEQVRAGLLTHEQASRHPQRNLVTRALGSKPEVQVDLFEGELSEGDTLLLCSDGLTGRVTDQELAFYVTRYPPKEAARQLVALANERGGNDNITVLIISARAEAPTVKVAPPAPPATLPAGASERKIPLVPIIAGGVAVLLVLVVGGFLAARTFLKSAETATPAATAIGTIPSPSAETAAPTASPSPAQAATATPPVPPTTAPPTATLASTPTPTPSPTPHPLRLIEPQPNAELKGRVTFKWEYSPSLAQDEVYEVRIWKKGDTEHWSVEVVSQTEKTIDLDVVLPGRGGPGRYFWTVVIIHKDTGEALSPEATPRPFTYTGP